MNQVKILDENIRSIVARERSALSELIAELRKLDKIRGYEKLGFGSLFDYLVKGVGYSAGAAQRRIDATRLSAEVPGLGDKLRAGALDLYHVTLVSRAVRQARRKRDVLPHEKREILARLEGEAETKSQFLVAEYFDLDVISESRCRVQKDKSVRLETTVSAEVAELIEEAQALVSHAVPTKDIGAFLEYVSKKIIKEKKSMPAGKSETGRASGYGNVTATVAVRESDAMATGTAMVAVAARSNSNSRATPARVPQNHHRIIRSRQPHCAHCGSRWFLQTDHIVSRSRGGGHALENLQTLCGPCNRAKYRADMSAFQPASSLHSRRES